MGEFVTAEETPELFDDKEPAADVTRRPGWTEANILKASEANAIRDALLDLREAVRGGAEGEETVLNVMNFGAVGDGTTDDTAAIQTVLDAIGGTSGLVGYMPPGRYKVTATLTQTNTEGAVFFGDGLNTTAIVPSSALIGLPVIKLTNPRFCHFSNFRVEGIDDDGQADCGIQIHTASVVNGRVATKCVFENIRMGTDDVTGLEDGFRLTCGGSPGGADDVNNDIHSFIGCSVYNCSGKGLSIEHNNSLCHTITDCNFSNVAVGVDAANGSYSMLGGFIVATEAITKVGHGTAYVNYHPCFLTGVMAENKTAAEAPKTVEIAGEAAKVYFTNCSLLGGNSAPTNMVDVTGDDVELSFKNCWVGYGQPDQTLSITGEGCDVTFDGCHLGFTDMVWGAGSGILRLFNNIHEPGTVTETMDATGRVIQIGDIGAQYTYTTVRGLTNFSDDKVWTDTTHTMTSADEQAIIMQRNGTIGGRPSPIFYLGRIDGGTGGTTPRYRLLYSDNSIVERSVFEVNYQGKITSLQDGTRRDIFNSKIDAQDSADVLALSSTPAAQLGLGNGGTDAIDTFIRRTGSSELSLMTGASPATAAKVTSTGLNIPTGKSLTVTDSAYSNAIRFGSYYLWVDASGRLRIHSSAPVSESDGTIVGTQA